MWHCRAVACSEIGKNSYWIGVPISRTFVVGACYRQVSTQSGRDSKGSRHVYWCYIATSKKIHLKVNGLMWRHKNVERARSFKSINERAI